MADKTTPEVNAPSALPTQRRWIVRFVGGMAGLITLIVVVFAVVTVLSYFTITKYIKGDDVLVPNIVNRTTTEALEVAGSSGLYLQFDEGEYSDTVAEGNVLRQHPRPERVAKTGTAVQVVVSRGPFYTTVPDVVELNSIDAGIVLRSNDLDIGVVSLIHHPTIEADEVISQSPRNNEGGLRRGQSVNLLVSLGPAPEIYTSPDLRGLTVPEAQSALEPLGVRVGEQSERSIEGSVVQGIILEHSPPAGAALPVGTEISVVTARRVTNLPSVN